MTITERMEMIQAMTNSLTEAVKLYEEYQEQLYVNGDILPPTKTALERRCILLREELLMLAKEI